MSHRATRRRGANGEGVVPRCLRALDQPFHVERAYPCGQARAELSQAHQVLVGMDTEMVVHSRGKSPKKVREKDGDTEYEEWIYGEPPQDVDFVRIVGDEVVRVETMKVGGQKIVRTEKEVILEKSDKDTEAKREERPANAPSLRRPGEDSENAPKPTDGISPVPISVPNTPQPPGNPGPGDIVAGRK